MTAPEQRGAAGAGEYAVMIREVVEAIRDWHAAQEAAQAARKRERAAVELLWERSKRDAGSPFYASGRLEFYHALLQRVEREDDTQP
jgi:hypothetical protein